MPIVSVVKRKVFETDSNGNIVYREGIDKKMYPVQKKDINGKNIFKTETGKFLNCDQFWKNLGGKTSYAKIQDDYNKFIAENIISFVVLSVIINIIRLKMKKKIDDVNDKIKEMKTEFERNKKLNNIEIETTKEISKIDSKNILNPVKRKFVGYKDVNKLIDYSKQIQKQNSNNQSIIKKKDVLIN